MKKIAFVLLLAALSLASVLGVGWIARAQASGPSDEIVLTQEILEQNRREISAPETLAGEQPNIGFIESPSATCYQPDATQDACWINWYYLAVDASPNYMITMTAQINQFGKVANVNGFFQTSMYVPYNMFGNGFKVACGALGAGGNPTLGNAYGYTIRARDSSGLGSANYGTVYCPAFTP